MSGLDRLEFVKPADIEGRSFEIIGQELGQRKLDPENELVIKRVIHTTADFEYADHRRRRLQGGHLDRHRYQDGTGGHQ